MGRTRLQVTFKNTAGKSLTLSIADPKEGLGADAVKAAFKDVAEKNLIVNKKGDAVNELRTAKIINIEETKLF